ncbi:MAG: alpha/beta fold hydrolase [Vicingaceae bacterium]
MKKCLLIFSYLLPSLLFAQNNDTNYKTAQERGQQIFTNLEAKTFDKLNSYFSEELRKKLTVNKLEETFKDFSTKYGTPDSLLEFVEKVTAEQTYYEQGIQFSNGKMDVVFALNEAKELTTLRVVPYSDKTKWKIPNYVNPQQFDAYPIKLGSEMPLLGEFTKPVRPESLVVVVMVHGSGPNDMNESLGPNQIFKDLAYGLASNGIASLRYNKRSYDYKKTIIKSGKQYDIDQIVTNDAVKAVNKAKELGADKVVLLGHSLGGHLAPKIASQAKVDGVIIMAGNVSPLEDLILPQIDYLRKHDSSAINQMQYNQLKWQVENLKKGNYDSTTAGPMLPFGAGGKFWSSLKDYQPQKISKKQDVPYLILNGERDYQVTVQEAKKWKDGSKNENSKTIIYPQLNHLFIAGEGIILPAEYEKEGHVEKEVIMDIVNWVSQL